MVKNLSYEEPVLRKLHIRLSPILFPPGSFFPEVKPFCVCVCVYVHMCVYMCVCVKG